MLLYLSLLCTRIADCVTAYVSGAVLFIMVICQSNMLALTGCLFVFYTPNGSSILKKYTQNQIDIYGVVSNRR